MKTPLHHCAYPRSHSCLAWGSVGLVLGLWWLGLFQIGAALRAWFLPGQAPLSQGLIWGGSLLVDLLWAVAWPILGGTLAHTMVMGSCTRVLERVAQWQSPPPSERPVVIERVSLDAASARTLGFEGAVMVERVYGPPGQEV